MPHTTRSLAYASFALLGLSLSAPAASSSGVQADSGKFTTTVQEAAYGSDSFKINADGSTVFDEQIQIPAPVSIHCSIKTHNGCISAIEASAPGHGRFTFQLTGTHGSLSVDGKPATSTTAPAGVLPFGNAATHLIAYLIAAYNPAKGGVQPFTVMVVEGTGPNGPGTTKATMAFRGTGQAVVAGKRIALRRYALVLAGPIGNVDTEVTADPAGRVLVWKVPGQKLVSVRDGYKDLLRSADATDPTLSQPTYAVTIDRNVKLPMRDGVKLAADVYRPAAPGQFPVILQRTPYGRSLAIEASMYAKRGYVFVAQDVRGRGDSGGSFHPFVNECDDGSDSVEWCANQPWSTGNVGMIGGSYLGYTQWAAASEGSPHLKCIVPIVSPPDPFFNVPYAFGALFFSPTLWWASVVDGGRTTITDPLLIMRNIKALETLPLRSVDSKILGHPSPFYQETLRHPTNDSYWQRGGFNSKMAQMGPLPALNVSGWFDGDGIGTKINYRTMVATGHANQRLIYGPWAHAVNTTSKVGPLDFGPQSLRDLDTLYIRWFDHWLKAVENGVEKEKPVEVFLMGANQWRSFNAWPPTTATMARWYLHSDGHAQSTGSDGTLALQPPRTGEHPDRYVYNPAHPYIPGSLRRLIGTGKGSSTDVTLGPLDREPDIVSYQSARLQHDVTVAGPVELHLCAATSGRDTDWWANLSDIRPDGKAIGLSQGIIRARFRKSFSNPTPVTPGAAEEYVIDLWAVGNVFKKGHRISLEISSSCFPIYDRNLNTGENIATSTRMVTAHQQIFHSAGRESYLLLPTLPE